MSEALEVAHCSKFLLVRSRAEAESAQSLRVWSMNGTTCPARHVVPIAALHQIIFDAGRAIVERMVRYQGRSTHVSSSSQDRLPSLTSTFRSGWERTLSMVFVFILHGYRALYVSLCQCIVLESRGRVGRFRGVVKVQKLPTSRSHPS